MIGRQRRAGPAGHMTRRPDGRQKRAGADPKSGRRARPPDRSPVELTRKDDPRHLTERRPTTSTSPGRSPGGPHPTRAPADPAVDPLPRPRQHDADPPAATVRPAQGQRVQDAAPRAATRWRGRAPARAAARAGPHRARRMPSCGDARSPSARGCRTRGARPTARCPRTPRTRRRTSRRVRRRSRSRASPSRASAPGRSPQHEHVRRRDAAPPNRSGSARGVEAARTACRRSSPPPAAAAPRSRAGRAGARRPRSAASTFVAVGPAITLVRSSTRGRAAPGGGVAGTGGRHGPRARRARPRRTAGCAAHSARERSAAAAPPAATTADSTSNRRPVGDGRRHVARRRPAAARAPAAPRAGARGSWCAAHPPVAGGVVARRRGPTAAGRAVDAQVPVGHEHPGGGRDVERHPRAPRARGGGGAAPRHARDGRRSATRNAPGGQPSRPPRAPGRSPSSRRATSSTTATARRVRDAPYGPRFGTTTVRQ